MKRIRMEVVKKGRFWRVMQEHTELTLTATQAQSIELARMNVEILLGQGHTVTLKIKRRDGTIREERTYPRSSDPKRSKG